MGLNGELGGVENGEPVDNVGTEVGVNILGLILAVARTVGRPVREVTNNLQQ